jgi:hypothetical protein
MSHNIPIRAGVNYAPADPLLRLGEKTARSHYLNDALKERFNHFWNYKKESWDEMIAAGEVITQIIQGNHLVERNPWNGGWLVIQPAREDSSTRRSLNLTQFYVTNCLVKWGFSNPDVAAKPGADSDQSMIAARGADIIVDRYEQKFYTPWFTFQEGLQALTFGTYIERLRYDAGVKGAVGLREVVENRIVQLGEGAGFCGDCGVSAPAAAFGGSQGQEMGEGEGELPICPQCGSNSVLIEPPAVDEIPTVTGQEPVQMGDLLLDVLSLSACRWDLRFRAEESNWFLHQQRVGIGAIRQLLGNVKLPGSPGDSDSGLDLAKRLAYSGQAIEGRSRTSGGSKKGYEPEEHNLCEMWLSPDDYSDVILKGDEKTVGGEALPAGVNLAELFPEGLVAVGLNGFSTCLGIYAEKHKECIASGTWHMKLMSGAGRGIGDVVEVQKRFNKLDSQQLTYMDAAATPATLIDKSILSSDEADYIGTPRANIFVDMTQLPNMSRLSDAVLQLSPAAVPGQFVQYVQQFLTGAFSTTSHATDFTNGGIVGKENDTARAAMIADANANSLFGPLLQIKGEVRKSIAEKIVSYYKAYFPIKRYFPLGGSYGEQQGIWLAGADLDADITFEVIKESEMPQNSLTKQDKSTAFYMGLFGGFANYLQAKQVAPSEVAELAQIWNVATTTIGFDMVTQRCRRRIEQLKQGLGVGIADPMALVSLLQPPISLFEKDQDQKALYYQEWLDTDEGLGAPPELRGAVEMMIQQHFQIAGVQQAAIAGQAGQAAGPEAGAGASTNG